MHGERAGFNNPAWDQQFLDLIENDPAALTEMTHAEYATLGGFEGAEVIMWLVMRGALSANVERVHSAYYLPSMTGIGTLVLENEGGEPPDGCQRAAPRADGAISSRASRSSTGTYPFDFARSVKAYRLNKFLHDVIVPANRAPLPRRPGGVVRRGGPHRRRAATWSGAATGRA